MSIIAKKKSNSKKISKDEEDKWIKREILPAHDCLCIVMNAKGWMRYIKANYDSHHDVFRLADPNYRDTLLLDVTHYLIIPNAPIEMDDS